MALRELTGSAVERIFDVHGRHCGYHHDVGTVGEWSCLPLSGVRPWNWKSAPATLVCKVSATGRQTGGARPARTSPEWNPSIYNPLVEAVQNELVPMPGAGRNAMID